MLCCALGWGQEGPCASPANLTFERHSQGGGVLSWETETAVDYHVVRHGPDPLHLGSDTVFSNSFTLERFDCYAPHLFYVQSFCPNGAGNEVLYELPALVMPVVAVRDDEKCQNDSLLLVVGYAGDAHVRLKSREAAIVHTDTIFLPDGASCGSTGCSYISSATFTQFDDDAVVETVEDIMYVRINMEHSFAGDLYMRIACPNGQSADILRFGGLPNTTCASSIGSQHRGWRSGANDHASTYFGNPETNSNAAYPCDPDAAGNAMGEGWNYCWSNAQTYGYTYPPGDGYIYRNGNSTMGRFDSSFVSLGQHFYHPDDSFASLVGCPLNGTWNIEVMDGYSSDNGYVFGWELKLNHGTATDRLDSVVSIVIDGPYGSQVSDSTFLILPQSAPRIDSVVVYHCTLHTLHGCSIDTAIEVRFHPSFEGNFFDTVCGHELPFVWRGHSCDEAGDYTQSIQTAWGCDSVSHHRLTVHPDFETTDEVEACDSVWWIDGQRYNQSILSDGPTVLLQTCSGCDSLVELQLTLRNGYAIAVVDSICRGEDYRFDGAHYSDAGTYVDSLQTMYHCDSIRTLTLKVYEVPTLTMEQGYQCDPPVIVLAATTDADGVEWSSVPTDPGLTDVHAMTIEVNPATPTRYECSASFASNGFCARKVEVSLQPFRVPEAVIRVTPEFLTNESLRFEAIDGSRYSDSRSWWMDDVYVTDAPRFEAEASKDADSVVLRLEVSDGDCHDDTTMVLYVYRASIYAPNAFTPELQNNNRFYVKGDGILDYHIDIYRRNGDRVFASSDMDEGWDGTHRGQLCPEEAYVYIVRYRDATKPRQEQLMKGQVLLIR